MTPEPPDLAPAHSAGPDPGPPRPDRRHDLDALRAAALLLGVAYHAAHAYSPSPPAPWLIREPADAPWLTHLQATSHLLRMPLFFFIAGYFAHDLIARRGLWGMLRHRLARIGAPFALFLPPLTLSFFALALEARARLPALPLTPQAGVHTMHLWFLWYLLLFCLLTAALHRLPWPAGLRRLPLDHPLAPLLLPALLLPGLLSAPLPLPSPTALRPQAWPFLWYGLFFLAGHTAWRRPAWPGPLGRGLAPLALLFALGLPPYLSDLQTDPTALRPRLLQAWLAAAGVTLALAAGQRWLSAPRPLTRYLADASYWIYLAHLPVVFACHLALAPLPWPPLAKLALTLTATLACTLATYALLVRPTPLGRLLNGRRIPLRPPEAADPASRPGR